MFCLEDNRNTSVYVFITEIIWRTFWCNKWRSVFDVVKNLRLSAANPRILTLHRTIIHIFSIPWLGWAEVTNFHTMFCWTFWLESVQDFLIKLDLKPFMHLVEISIFSLNHVIVRLTKIMNNFLEHLKILTFKDILLC